MHDSRYSKVNRTFFLFTQVTLERESTEGCSFVSGHPIQVPESLVPILCWISYQSTGRQFTGLAGLRPPASFACKVRYQSEEPQEADPAPLRGHGRAHGGRLCKRAIDRDSARQAIRPSTASNVYYSSRRRLLRVYIVLRHLSVD